MTMALDITDFHREDIGDLLVGAIQLQQSANFQLNPRQIGMTSRQSLEEPVVYLLELVLEHLPVFFGTDIPCDLPHKPMQRDPWLAVETGCGLGDLLFQ